MANLLLGFPNRVDQATLSGGSWAAGLPLANLQTRLLSRVARSNNLATASTTIVIDFGQPQRLRILALIAHNISLQGKVRFEASTVADFSSHAYDLTTDVWGGLLTATWDLNALEWENNNFWLGTYSSEDIEGFTSISTHIMDASVAARYWRITIMDPLNTDGFVQLGRLFLGPAIQPRLNYSWGASLGYETLTEIKTAIGGAEFFDVREPTRVFRFSLEFMQDEEAFGKMLELTRRAGVHGEIFVVPDPADVFQGLRRNFMGRNRQISALEQSTWANGGSAHSMAFEIKEIR